MRWGKTISKRRLAAKILAEVEAMPKGSKSVIAKRIGVSNVTRSLRSPDAHDFEFIRVAAHYGYAPIGNFEGMFAAVEKKEAA
ncbi:hypothetical protein [Methylosinus sp. PW1]|uniref:hypothetical protein n=1 Tax=Methylosinus sp. PW1 TaxID=107636 RepID=UPI00056684C0|nr:hypothetical protein [Methylosinus sp. PW1]